MVTHDQEEALTMADRIVVMNNAVIMQVDTPQNIYENPCNPFVADFIGSVNFMNTNTTPSSDGSIIAIRPENILIHHSQDNDTVKAVITDMEYRGNFYRITVKTHENSQKSNNLLYLDVPSNEVSEKMLSVNKIIPVKLKESKVLKYTNRNTISSGGFEYVAN